MERYLSYFFGDAGPHSLKRFLKKQNLISSLSTWFMDSSAGQQVFLIFELTPSGEKEYESVLEGTFGLLNAVNGGTVDDDGAASEGSSSSPAGARGETNAYYTSLAKFLDAEFAWQPRSSSEMDTVSHLARALTMYEVPDVLTGDATILATDQELLGSVFGSFTADNMNVGLATAADEEADAGLGSKEEIEDGVEVAREKFYDIPYRKEKLPGDLLDRLRFAKMPVGVTLPAPLAYVPSADAKLLDVKAGHEPEFVPSHNLYWAGIQAPHLRVPKAELAVQV